ncbi:MAG: HDIG domain-containing protein [Bacteroidales bacterium]|nr:HDIG domain-containing protein [Bacteroidales bacterium]
MEKINFPKKFKAYLPLIALFVLLVFIMPKSPKFNYDYRKGSPWMYETLIAQFDFPILKTDAQLQAEREKAGLNAIPYFRVDGKASSGSMSAVSGLDLGKWSDARMAISDAVTMLYSKGIMAPAASLNMEELLQNSEGLIYVQKNRRAEKVPVSEVFTLEEASSMMRETLAAACPGCDIDSLYSAAGIASLIAPDLIFDQQTTDLIHEESIDYVSVTQGVVRAGQVIVSEGEMVTAEIEQLLDSYKAEFDMGVGYGGPRVYMWLGNIFIAFCIVFVLFLAICYCNFRIFDEYNKYLYLLMIFALAATGSSLVADIDSSLFYLMPFTLISLYLLAFFTKRMVFSVYFISLLPMLIFAPNGVELFVMYLVAGSVAMLVFGFFNRGWLQFVTALIVFVVMTMVWGAFRLTDGISGLTDYHTVLDMGLGALLSVACYPLIYLFEKIFKLVSNTKLAELSDTNNKLLRLLADKAPGTFQHCLQVMNLADAAARSIDANVLLVRAGALYHDIGKISNPQCFTENENPGVQYHAGLTVKESAQEIIRHVSDGLALADKHGLPDVIKEFIVSHHGTTCTGYFLTKYLNDGGNPDETAEFYYDGVKPVTKEQVILMVCDAVEAASRSLKDYSPESISALVDRIADGKAKEDQFTDADISLRELNTLKEVIKSYLQQMYHSRVSYPKRKVKAGK